MDILPKIVVILGPTASGKSGVALGLAERVDGEIVSADSGAVFRRLDIGTAKPTPEERERIPHHLIDMIDPDQRFDAMAYRTAAHAAIGTIIARGRIPIIAGGTGLYVRALMFGLLDINGSDQTREVIKRELAGEMTAGLYAALREADPKSADRIKPNDRVRIERALEIHRMTGIPASKLQDRHGFRTKQYDALTFGLLMERRLLYERIDRRTDEMVKKGMVQETERILQTGYAPTSPGLMTIGYKEIVAYLLGTIDRDGALSLIKKRTRNYAKRQMTWFRRVEGIHWIAYPYDIDGMADRARQFMRGSC
jgi:tRNA dimethylallyltransferase